MNDRITVNGGGMNGSREFQFLVIPRHEGTYSIPPIAFSYFDARDASYRTLTSDTLTFTVGKGDGTASSSSSFHPGVSQVQVLDRDIRTIRVGDLELEPAGHELFGSVPWIAGMSAPGPPSSCCSSGSAAVNGRWRT